MKYQVVVYQTWMDYNPQRVVNVIDYEINGTLLILRHTDETKMIINMNHVASLEILELDESE